MGSFKTPENCFRRRHCWVCRLWNHKRHCPTKQEIPQSNTGISNTKEHIRHSFLVRPSKSSFLHLQYGQAHAPFPWTFELITKFYWDEALNRLFETSNANIIREIQHGVRIFDKTKPTCLATDWSQTGLGFTLLQKSCTCTGTTPFCCHDGWKTVLVGSRFSHPAEYRYAPIEGEADAVASLHPVGSRHLDKLHLPDDIFSIDFAEHQSRKRARAATDSSHWDPVVYYMEQGTNCNCKQWPMPDN